MKILSIAFKDLQILLKDRGALFQLFILPLFFILVFSGALGAIASSEQQEVQLPRLAVVDLDGGLSAQDLLRKLTADGSLAVQSYSAADAQAQLDDNAVIGVVTIPAGFTTGLQQNTPVTLVFNTGSDADPQVVEAARLVIESLAADMTLESQIIASLQQMGTMQASAPERSQLFTTDKALAQAHNQFISSQTRPLIVVTQSTPQRPEQVATADLSQSAVPGFTVLFAFLAAQTTAHSIYDEKKIGSFRRIVAAPLSKFELLAGKIMPNFLVCLVQVAVILTFGSLGLRLLKLTPLPVGNALFGTIIVAILLALCSSAFGIAIAAIARTENQISGLSTLLVWGMGLLGGSMVPLFVLERLLGPISMIVPHYWANKAFDDLLIRGLGLGDVYLSLVMLGVFTLIFFAIGLWRFDFER